MIKYYFSHSAIYMADYDEEKTDSEVKHTCIAMAITEEIAADIVDVLNRNPLEEVLAALDRIVAEEETL